MSDRSAEAVRLEVFNSYREVFASAPIRLMSRTAAAMRSKGYDDLATAIGDIDWRTVPPAHPADPTLRHDWKAVLEGAFEYVGGWLRQLSGSPMGYNLDSIGYPVVTRAWSKMWERQLGIEFANRPGRPAEVFVFHGGNQALQAALLGIAEAHRDRVGVSTPATVLVPLPTFSCPMDQMALQGMRAVMLPPTHADTDPHPDDLDNVPGDVDVDGVYLMPVNNPTGRTVEPGQLRDFISAVLDRWPHAGVVLDSVYVRLHERYRDLLAFYDTDPRFADSLLLIDSLSKTHGVTGLRAGAVLTRSPRLYGGVVRYAQNVMAGPSNAMQAVMYALLAPFLSGDEELIESRIRLQMRIGRHLQERRRLLMRDIFDRFPHLFDDHQPLLPDPDGFDWPGSMYAAPRLSEECVQRARERDVWPTVELYLQTGVAGVPLDGFCRNPNLDRHNLVVNADDERRRAFVAEASRYVRLSFGMTPPPG